MVNSSFDLVLHHESLPWGYITEIKPAVLWWQQVFSAYHLYLVPSQWQEANQADKEHIHSYLLIFLTSTVTMTVLVSIQTNISDMEVVHFLYTLWLWAKSLIFNMNIAFICIMDSVTVFLSMFWANLYTYIYHFHYPFLKTKPTVYTCTAKHPITDSLLLDVCHQYATPVLKCYKFHSHQIWPKSSSLR